MTSFIAVVFFDSSVMFIISRMFLYHLTISGWLPKPKPSSETVSMGDPNKYSAQGGVLTFRGGPLRQNAAYGTVEVTEEQLSVVRGMRTSRIF